MALCDKKAEGLLSEKGELALFLNVTRCLLKTCASLLRTKTTTGKPAIVS
jgi:hypothetical protein